MLRSSCLLLLLLTSWTRVCLTLAMPGGATSVTESLAAFNIAPAPYAWPGEEEQMLESLELLQRLIGRNFPLPLLAKSLRMYRKIKSRKEEVEEKGVRHVRPFWNIYFRN